MFIRSSYPFRGKLLTDESVQSIMRGQKRPLAKNQATRNALKRKTNRTKLLFLMNPTLCLMIVESLEKNYQHISTASADRSTH